MKTAINVILGLCAVVLLYICYGSIMEPIHFNEEKAVREAAVRERLIQIRDAQDQYRQQHDMQFCERMSELIEFVKTAKVPFVNKVGDLTDAQMEKGLTESKAAAIVNSGDAAAIAANGLQNFRRDTTWVVLIDTIFGKGFNADSLEYIPYSNGDKFEMITGTLKTKSGIYQNVMECGAKYDAYLKGMNSREIYNLNDAAEKSGRYPGLKIGDLYTNNNNAGNWE